MRILKKLLEFILVNKIIEDVDKSRLPSVVYIVKYRWLFKVLIQKRNEFRKDFNNFKFRFKTFDQVLAHYKYTVFPTLYSGECIRPQPMRGPTGMVYALKYIYKNKESF